MSFLRLVFQSLLHHGRLNAAVALGVAAASAVLTGALLVGDSVRESLRQLTLDRLGRIEQVLVVQRFFREPLAGEIQADAQFQKHFFAAVPLVLLQGSLEAADGSYRAGDVSLFGCDEVFFQLGSSSAAAPRDDEILLNEPLAARLRVQPGQELIVRLPRISAVPEDNPLGRKSNTVITFRATVKGVLPASGLGRFGLHPTQQLPLNAYVARSRLQAALGQRGKVNAIFIGGKHVTEPAPAEQDAVLKSALKPTLADYGLTLTPVPTKDAPAYYSLTSDRMLLESQVVHAAERAFTQQAAQPVLTYLANYILAGESDRGKIPYSTVSALELHKEPPFGPFLNLEGKPLSSIGPGEILLNRWAADDFKAQGVELKPGDGIKLVFFEPEDTHGTARERTVTLRLADIVDLVGPAADRQLTPEVKGVTDQASIDDWDPPFPYDDKRVRSRPPNDQDEKYWDDYGATPKAFVSLATGTGLWKSRFGERTSIRIPATGNLTPEQVARRLLDALEPASLGFEFRPIKRQGLMAAEGTTPFGVLFLSFSMFLIAAAIMLVALLFRLGSETRASELGLLLAIGFTARQVRRLLVIEGLFVASLGSLLGIGIGIGYASLMLAGLRSPQLWLKAVSTPFLHLYPTAQSLIIGYFSGVVVSCLAIVAAVRQMGAQNIRSLLANQAHTVQLGPAKRTRWSNAVMWCALPLSLVVAVSGIFLTNEAQAGAFFGSGALMLTGMLAALWSRLRSGGRSALVIAGGMPLIRLAARNAARNPGRSALTIGLVSSATFLIVAISAFHIDPTDRLPEKHSGDGGFALVAQSDKPLFYDLNTVEGRRELAFTEADSRLLSAAQIFSLRVNSGDDASCLNLYQTTQPRVLGIPEGFIARNGFAWGPTSANSAPQRDNPWTLLRKIIPSNPAATLPEAVPVVVDANTATYSLKKGVGDRLRLDDGSGQSFDVQIVGLLTNSIFQGDLLMSEAHFLQRFPQVSGARFFLIESPPAQAGPIEEALTTTLGLFGFSVERSGARLDRFLAVQNTYLQTFQSLGGLGLLLGTFGLATVQLRNVFERRGELALLRAAGFRRSRLAWLVMIESTLLLLGGLGIGIVSAAVAILPHLLAGGATIPWQLLTAMLAAVLIAGLAAGFAAVRATLLAPILPALRGD